MIIRNCTRIRYPTKWIMAKIYGGYIVNAPLNLPKMQWFHLGEANFWVKIDNLPEILGVQNFFEKFLCITNICIRAFSSGDGAGVLCQFSVFFSARYTSIKMSLTFLDTISIGRCLLKFLNQTFLIMPK